MPLPKEPAAKATALIVRALNGLNKRDRELWLWHLERLLGPGPETNRRLYSLRSIIRDIYGG